MYKKQRLDVSVWKHTGKSIFIDDGSKKINIILLGYNEDTYILKAYEDAYGLTFEAAEDNDGVPFVTITKGGKAIRRMNANELIEKLLK